MIGVIRQEQLIKGLFVVRGTRTVAKYPQAKLVKKLIALICHLCTLKEHFLAASSEAERTYQPRTT